MDNEEPMFQDFIDSSQVSSQYDRLLQTKKEEHKQQRKQSQANRKMEEEGSENVELDLQFKRDSLKRPKE